MHHQQLKRDNYVLIKYDGGGKPHGVLQSNNPCALIGIPTLIDKGHTTHEGQTLWATKLGNQVSLILEWAHEKCHLPHHISINYAYKIAHHFALNVTREAIT